jgi:hypothetical protein
MRGTVTTFGHFHALALQRNLNRLPQSVILVIFYEHRRAS